MTCNGIGQWTVPLLDSPVILLHDVVQVSVGSDHDKLPLGVLSAQQAQPGVARHVPIKMESARFQAEPANATES
jgi:hypothetical protein